MKNYLHTLKKCLLFKDLSDDEILNVLTCIDADVKRFSKDDYILKTGDIIDFIGILLSGNALVIQEDLWGNRNIMIRLSSSDFFAEPYAIIPDAALNVSVVATDDCEVMKINIHKMLAMCTSVCTYHNSLIQNLITAFAQKTLMFNDKITHMSKRKTRDKILSYLSAEAIRQKSVSFNIPFDRQQLADFLCVERSAMSAEISKLQKEGIIKTSHSHLELNINPI